MYGELAPISRVELEPLKVIFDGVEYDAEFNKENQEFTLTLKIGVNEWNDRKRFSYNIQRQNIV